MKKASRCKVLEQGKKVAVCCPPTVTQSLERPSTLDWQRCTRIH
jgi:hypothetical protein